jgi:hypothetical protein
MTNPVLFVILPYLAPKSHPEYLGLRPPPPKKKVKETEVENSLTVIRHALQGNLRMFYEHNMGHHLKGLKLAL